MPGLVQVTQGRAVADSPVVVGNAGADAGGVRMVVVSGGGVARGNAGVVEGPLGWVPCIGVGMMDEDRALGAVEIVGVVSIGLHAPEVRERPLVAPGVVAPGSPGIVVVRRAPVES